MRVRCIESVEDEPVLKKDTVANAIFPGVIRREKPQEE